ncbi:MAG: hypothetical protein FRX48_05529 [Lasallia pustulata]|uniref:Uncharacterized protein n=1 Tax=Lasallia pustulata TaxID=136370 RepID=A0A5M8PMF7_9LECA|nr:MAG: hypothetical protein FRX48_05529 [Lasallia pustulata]
MGREKKKLRDRLHTQAFFGDAPTGRDVPQTPQRLLSQAASGTETPIQKSEDQALAGELLQTVARQPARTSGPNSMKENELDLEHVLRARSLKLELSSLAIGDKKFVFVKYDQQEQYEEVLDSYVKQFNELATIYVENKKEEFVATNATIQDKTKSLAIRMEAGLSRWQPFLAVQMECVDLGLCKIQLFNAPKVFCWPMFSYNRALVDRAARHGIQLKEDPSGALVQICDDSGRTAAENIDKDKKKRAPRKSSLKSLLSEYNENITQILKDIQAVSVSIKEEEVKVPCVPESTTFFDPSVEVEIPEHIIQSISDILFMSNEVHASNADLMAQRNILLNSLRVWKAMDNDFWECTKKSLQNNPVAKEYEYKRRAFVALYAICRREDSKAYKYVEENGLIEKLVPGLKERLDWHPSPGDHSNWENNWQTDIDRLNNIFPPTEKLVHQCEGTSDKSTKSDEARATAQHGDWWKVLLPHST